MKVFPLFGFVIGFFLLLSSPVVANGNSGETVTNKCRQGCCGFYSGRDKIIYHTSGENPINVLSFLSQYDEQDIIRKTSGRKRLPGNNNNKSWTISTSGNSDYIPVSRALCRSAIQLNASFKIARHWLFTIFPGSDEGQIFLTTHRLRI